MARDYDQAVRSEQEARGAVAAAEARLQDLTDAIAEKQAKWEATTDAAVTRAIKESELRGQIKIEEARAAAAR